MLAEGRDVEAERIARAAARVLEKGGHQSLLAEALTTHGAALARLGNYAHARLVLFRAVEVAHMAGALNYAGEAALTIIEELGERLSADEMHTVYERADRWLSSAQDKTTLLRLHRAANRVLATGREREGEKVALIKAGRSYSEEVQHYEAQLIR